MRDPGLALVVAAAIAVQALVFHSHYAMSLTVLVGLGLGLWLRSWTAAGWSLAAFLVAYALALVTGWLHDARLIADTLLGAGLAVAGGLIGGGIFDLARRDTGIHTPLPARSRRVANEPRNP